jgi:hypothetical protein
VADSDELMPVILENFKTTQAWAKARYGDLAAAYNEPGGYAQGGYIPGNPVRVQLHPDECLIAAKDVYAGRLVCSRAGHPTATSDCRDA